MLRGAKSRLAAPLLGLLLLSLGACGNDPGGNGGVDAGQSDDADTGTIGGGLDSGIGLRFVSQPVIVGSFEKDGTKVTIEGAEFQLSDLRLIGDSATGDDRTTRSLFSLAWQDAKPVDLVFDEAPPGMYSRVRATVTDLRIDAEVEPDEGDAFDLEVEADGLALDVEFDMLYELEAGSVLELEVVVDLQRITEEIPFGDLEISDGKAEISDESEAMDKVLEKTTEAFEISGPL